ncbi:MAG: PrsW family glutamic-type intramembrane protease [Sandaracinaceae bacterium]
MMVAFAMASAVVPSLLLLWYFHSRDSFPEPPRVVWTTFALGALAIIPVCVVAFPFAMLIEAVLGGVPLLHGPADAFLTAAIPEETFKLAVLAWYAGRHSEFDEPMDGVVYGAAASLGFATLENALYCADGGLTLAAIRALTAVPIHAGCGALMGYWYGRSRFEPERRRSLLARAWIVPVLIHGVYDAPLLTLKGLVAAGDPPLFLAAPLACLGIVVVVIVFVATIVIVRRARRRQAERGPPVPLPPRDPMTASTGTRVGGFALLGFAGLSATVGGTFFLAVAIVLATEGTLPTSAPGAMIGAFVLFGIAPLAVGLGLFGLAIKLLNLPRAAVS